MNEELKPCPFCGGKDGYICCEKCGAGDFSKEKAGYYLSIALATMGFKIEGEENDGQG